jgi:hypothetical protein
VSQGTLSSGSFKAVSAKLNICPTTVAKQWHSTLNMVDEYQSNAPIDPRLMADNVSHAAFEMNFKIAGQNHSLAMRQYQKH